MSELVLLDVRDEIATITLNRPEKRNALSLELIRALGAMVIEVRARRDVRVVILAGAGRSFCAGMDLRGVVEDAPAMGRMLHELAQVSVNLRQLPMPTIARVQGAAIGGGCGLMVVTDFALTHAEAKLGYPEVDLGVCPAVVAPWLIRKIGAGRARAMLLQGGTLSGEEGLRVGLADRLVQADELDSEAVRFAGMLARGGREALRVTKHWLNELDGSLERETAERAAALSAEVIAGPEAQARLREKFGNTAGSPA